MHLFRPCLTGAVAVMTMPELFLLKIELSCKVHKQENHHHSVMLPMALIFPTRSEGSHICLHFQS